MIIVKEVLGYEGLYLIDSLGNVISMPKFKGRHFHNKYSILTKKLNKFGYYEVGLTKDGKVRTFLLHRLLAISFIPNPNNLPEVNHKNGIKSDNRLSNLEWCTRSENTKHAFDKNLSGFRDSAMARILEYNDKNKYIVIILRRGNEERSFSSVNDASVFLSTHRDNITRAIRKSGRVCGWYAFGIKAANGETQSYKEGNPVGRLENIK